MRGFWKTGKELSDRAEISQISSWALGDFNLWISARSDNVKGGLGLGGRNFRPDFPHEGKVGGGWNLAGFLVGARATKCIPPHPSATTGTEDRLTLSWFASLKRHECASLIKKLILFTRFYLHFRFVLLTFICSGNQEFPPCQISRIFETCLSHVLWSTASCFANGSHWVVHLCKFFFHFVASIKAINYDQLASYPV